MRKKRNQSSMRSNENKPETDGDSVVCTTRNGFILENHNKEFWWEVLDADERGEDIRCVTVSCACSGTHLASTEISTGSVSGGKIVMVIQSLILTALAGRISETLAMS
jgi:hypothetical protein